MVYDNLRKLKQSPLICLLFISTTLFLLKILLVMFMKTPYISDEFIYALTSKAILTQLTIIPINISSIDYLSYPPGYPLVITFAYLFNDPEIIYHIILIINAFLTTLLIPLTYFFSLYYLDAKHALITSFFVGISPTVLSYTFVIMSENLFIPLFMLSILNLYYATSSMNTKNWFLAGLLAGFLVLVRIQGIAMVVALGLLLLWGLFSKAFPIKNCFVSCLGTLIILGPYLVFRLNQTSTISGYPENYYISNLIESFSTLSGFLTFIHLTVNELGYLFICGLGVLSFLGILFIYKALTDTNLPTKFISIYFGISSFLTILLTILHMFGAYLGRGYLPQAWYEVFGRYLDPIIPPLMMFGIIYIFTHKYFSWRTILSLSVISLIIIFTFPCGTYHPGATWPIIYLQFYKECIPYQIIILLIVVLSTLVLIRLQRLPLKILTITLIFFFINLPAIHFHLANGSVENIGLWIKHQSPTVKQIYIDHTSNRPNATWVYCLFWNPDINIEYSNLTSEPPINLTKNSNRSTLLITDKSFDLPYYKGPILGNKVYDMTRRVSP